MVIKVEAEAVANCIATDDALEYACEKRKSLHYRVTVEGPNGVAMDEEELARCCALANQK